jgi:hypothetical protein
MAVLVIGEVPNLTEEIYSDMIETMKPRMQAAKGCAWRGDVQGCTERHDRITGGPTGRPSRTHVGVRPVRNSSLADMRGSNRSSCVDGRL